MLRDGGVSVREVGASTGCRRRSAWSSQPPQYGAQGPRTADQKRGGPASATPRWLQAVEEAIRAALLCWQHVGSAEGWPRHARLSGPASWSTTRTGSADA
jgi:hypothetical protein